MCKSQTQLWEIARVLFLPCPLTGAPAQVEPRGSLTLGDSLAGVPCPLPLSKLLKACLKLCWGAALA